jgi:dimethylargininase
VRRPSPRLADGIVSHIERQPLDLSLASAQWQGYCDAMSHHGWELIEVPPADHCPDSVFIEDAVVMFGDLAVITRPGAEARRDHRGRARGGRARCARRAHSGTGLFRRRRRVEGG